ncbi:hypothetical protein [Chondrinema litorale]|uniref:hypothetical protein n=1 Tax=Chondrinema litorale TaxID=2994555 RepID=UPI002542A5C7|nr:hypothetical protein [Chondrinema litorale]UZR99259.1 hypothetical protein OQ292_35345 [Chondrinema litorale]
MNDYLTTATTSHYSVRVPNWRLHIMRGLFFLNFISLAFDNWSIIFFPEEQMDTLTGVTISFWAAFSLLNLLGIRFPLKFIPILLLQLLYKSAWIIGTYLPAKNSGLLDENLNSFFWVCVTGIVLNLLIIPWKFVYVDYFKNFLRFR